MPDISQVILKPAMTNAAKVLLAAAVPATVLLWRFRSLLGNMAWWIIFVPIGIFAACLIDASLGCYIGTKRADNILKLVFGIGLVVGVYFLVRHLDHS